MGPDFAGNSQHNGHSSVTQTLDTYSHVLPVLEEKATDELRNVLFPKKAASQAIACLPPGDEEPAEQVEPKSKTTKRPRRPRKQQGKAESE